MAVTPLLIDRVNGLCALSSSVKPRQYKGFKGFEQDVVQIENNGEPKLVECGSAFNERVSASEWMVKLFTPSSIDTPMVAHASVVRWEGVTSRKGDALYASKTKRGCW